MISTPQPAKPSMSRVATAAAWERAMAAIKQSRVLMGSPAARRLAARNP